MLSLFLLGGSGGYSDFWWRYTGRYLAPTKKAKSSIFQTLVKATKAQEEEKKDEKGDAKADEDKGIKEDMGDDDKKPIEPSEMETAVSEGEVPDDSLGADDSLDDLGDLSDATDSIDTSDVADRVKDSFAEPPPRAAGMSDADRAERAKSLVTKKTVVGMVGSDWGAGDGGFGDSLSGGLDRVKSGNGFGGDLVVGGGAGSEWLDGEDGGIADVVGGPGGALAGLPGGPGGPGGGPDLAAFKPDDIGPDKGPTKVSGIGSEKIRKMDADKKPKVKEKRYKLNMSGMQGVSGGKVNRAAINKHLRARSSALQKCYVSVARKNPNVKGKLVLQIKIDLSGRATARVVKDATGDPRLGKCIVGKIRQWPFPKPEGKPVEFKIPFVFRAL
jgi:TonB family protein